MTTDEKRAKIKEHCQTLGVSCYSCPLYGRITCYGELANDKTVEENYKILEDAGAFKPKGDIHLKGYIFDSLMYRYQLAREKQVMWEITKENTNPETARHRYGHDVIRFREILEEIMGEHD